MSNRGAIRRASISKGWLIVFKAGILLTAGSAGVAALRFARNILLAQLVSVEDYGIASTFIVVLGFVALVGDLALDRFIVQDPRGEEPRFVAAVQAVIVVRAIVMSALMILAAYPTAALFGIAQLSWVFALLGLLPLVQAATHPDLFRFQRASRFESLVVSDLAGVGTSIVVMLPLALILADYRIMLAALFVELGCRALASHLLAERPFRCAWDNDVALKALSFGVPLILSGMALFVNMHGERILVASQFTTRDLGIFSAAFTLATTPGLLLTTIQQRYFLPHLVRAADTAGELAVRVNEALRITLSSGAGFAVAAFVLGAPMFSLVFGERFAEGADYVALLALITALSTMRSGPTVVALRLGHTLDIMAGNVVRLLALPIAILAVFEGGSIKDILVIGWLGETVALVTAYLLMRWRGTRPSASTLLVLAMALALSMVLGSSLAFEEFGQGALVAAVLLLGLMVVVSFSTLLLKRN
jgi:O-antigen/teichoic acid export membrane protein